MMGRNKPIGVKTPADDEVKRGEDEQICSRFLGWQMVASAELKMSAAVWRPVRPDGNVHDPSGDRYTPQFGLSAEDTAILVTRFLDLGYRMTIYQDPDGTWFVIAQSLSRKLMATSDEPRAAWELVRQVAYKAINT